MLTRSEALRRTKQEFARARRYGYPLTIAICRLDRIDHLADIYGAESRLLLVDELSRTFQSRARSTDVIGRLGEERLLWVLPHTDLPGSCLAAERLREAVQEIEVSSGRRTIHVTLSIGLACYVSRNTLFFDSIMMQAEEALERAQYRGGNQIDWHPLPEAFEQSPHPNRRSTDQELQDPGVTANERFAAHDERAAAEASQSSVTHAPEAVPEPSALDRDEGPAPQLGQGHSEVPGSSAADAKGDRVEPSVRRDAERSEQAPSESVEDSGSGPDKGDPPGTNRVWPLT